MTTRYLPNRRCWLLSLVSLLAGALVAVPAASVGAAVAPSAPTMVTAKAGDGLVLLSWLPPKDTSGQPLMD
jgi:hypothetical protein